MQTLFNYLLERREKYADFPAIQFKDQGRWIRYNWREYVALIEAFGAALITSGIMPGDRIAIISSTRPEWIIADLAIMGVGAVTVPVYPNNTDDDMDFIIKNSGASAVIVENANQYEKWRRLKGPLPDIKLLIGIDAKTFESKSYTSAASSPTHMVWSEMLETGREQLKADSRTYFDRAREVKLDDLATLVYTSGTTGSPKGVVLCHEQIMSEVTDAFSIVAVTHEDVSLSFLPYSHILGRLEAWGNVYAGYLLSFAESIEKIRANLIEVKPTFIISVPRIFEKIYASLLAQIENNKTKKRVFDRAFAIGQKVSEAEQNRSPLNLPLLLEHKIADTLVFSKVRENLGGRLRFAVSGGAPLSEDIARFFHGLGLLICEGYGLTETTAGVAFNTPIAYKIGTVGRPIGDVTIKFAEDGEILVKSKKVMREYYNNEAATNEVFAGGFFKTGDIGFLDDDGFLRITDRKKDLIKTANGKYVAPQKLENLLKSNPYISNVLIHGDKKKYIIALITLNWATIKKFAASENIEYASQGDLTKNSAIYNLIKDAVADVNSRLASHESIKKFAILPGEFTIDSGELTPSLKVKRKVCDQKYCAEIEALYN